MLPSDASSLVLVGIDVFLVRAKGLNTWQSMLIHAKNRKRTKNGTADDKPRRTPSDSRSVYVEVRTCADSKQPYDTSRSKAV